MVGQKRERGGGNQAPKVTKGLPRGVGRERYSQAVTGGLINDKRRSHGKDKISLVKQSIQPSQVGGAHDWLAGLNAKGKGKPHRASHPSKTHTQKGQKETHVKEN